MNETIHQGEVTTVRDLLEYYADRGYAVDEVSIDHSVPGTQAKRNTVSVELTLTEPMQSVLDRLDHDVENE